MAKLLRFDVKEACSLLCVHVHRTTIVQNLPSPVGIEYIYNTMYVPGTQENKTLDDGYTCHSGAGL